MAARHMEVLLPAPSVYSPLGEGPSFFYVRSQTGSTQLEMLEYLFDEVAVPGGVV